MVHLQSSSVGLMLLAVNIATVTAITATGSAANAVAATASVAYPGPKQSTAAEGPHPSYSWPPASSSTATPNCNKVQYNFPSGTNANTSRADAVRDLYRRSWDQYAEYCFGSDQILTLTNTCADDIFGWGATIVDGIDTAILMNLTDIVQRQLAHIAATDYT
jgi:mannosyl-oligosaccharide alpha-1,2-mannosidase